MINYREQDVAAALKDVCPDGVNCYFDNTCGPISDAVMTNLAQGARITICGTAALTDWTPIPAGPRVHRQLLVARARMQGFLVLDYKDRYPEALADLTDWIRDGKLAYNEHVLEGAAAAPDAINMLYEGRNNGKLLIRVGLTFFGPSRVRPLGGGSDLAVLTVFHGLLLLEGEACEP